MSKCPKCGSGIDHLVNFYLHWTEARFSLDDSEGGFKREYDSICMSDNLKDEYWCPECDKKLFRKEKDAIAFLKEVVKESKDASAKL